MKISGINNSTNLYTDFYVIFLKISILTYLFQLKPFMSDFVLNM